MSASSRRNVLGALAVILSSASVVNAAEPTTEPSAPDVNSQLQSVRSLLQQVKEQEKTLAKQQEKLEQLQQQQAAFGAAQHDAEAHSRLLDVHNLSAGFTSGRGFFLSSEDGNFLLHPWLQFQFRNVTNYRHDLTDDTNDTQNGFEVRRLKFGVDGNLFSPNFTYLFQFAVDRHTGNVQLEMAWTKYRFDGTPFAVRAGQFKDPVDHEQLAASRFFPAIDRTFINDQFVNSEGFIKGVSAIYDPGTWVRGEAAFTGGLKNYNTNFQPTPTNPANWGAAGRAEFKAFGNWKDYERISAYGIEHRTLVFGVGADYTEAGHPSALVHVADVQYQSTTG
ncbi:MAG TPA: porin, partial [Tepidisphaeraceae bacterium]